MVSKKPYPYWNPGSATGIFIDEQDNVYIADAGNNRILKYDPIFGQVFTPVQDDELESGEEGSEADDTETESEEDTAVEEQEQPDDGGEGEEEEQEANPTPSG